MHYTTAAVPWSSVPWLIWYNWRSVYWLICAHCNLSYPLPSVLWQYWLGTRKSIQPVKDWVMRCWRGYLSGARCKWFAYGPADVTATSSSLTSLKSRLVLPFWYQLTQVVLEKRPLNGCLSGCKLSCASACRECHNKVKDIYVVSQSLSVVFGKLCSCVHASMTPRSME